MVMISHLLRRSFLDCGEIHDLHKKNLLPDLINNLGHMIWMFMSCDEPCPSPFHLIKLIQVQIHLLRINLGPQPIVYMLHSFLLKMSGWGKIVGGPLRLHRPMAAHLSMELIKGLGQDQGTKQQSNKGWGQVWLRLDRSWSSAHMKVTWFG